MRKPAGTLYMAGEQGFLAAVDAVVANSRPDEVLLGSKDLSFYTDRRFVQWSGNLLTNQAMLQQRLAAKQVHLIVASKGQFAAASPEVARWLAEHTLLVANPGDQLVYRVR
jgi:hypothetical protein